MIMLYRDAPSFLRALLTASQNGYSVPLESTTLSQKDQQAVRIDGLEPCEIDLTQIEEESPIAIGAR